MATDSHGGLVGAACWHIKDLLIIFHLKWNAIQIFISWDLVMSVSIFFHLKWFPDDSHQFLDFCNWTFYEIFRWNHFVNSFSFSFSLTVRPRLSEHHKNMFVSHADYWIIVNRKWDKRLWCSQASLIRASLIRRPPNPNTLPGNLFYQFLLTMIPLSACYTIRTHVCGYQAVRLNEVWLLCPDFEEYGLMKRGLTRSGWLEMGPHL